MNALSQLIEHHMKQQNLKRGDLATLLGYENSNKALRQIDKVLTDLNDPEKLLSKLKNALNIPNHLMHAVHAEVSEQQWQKTKADFTPHINILTKNNLSRNSAWARSAQFESPNFQQEKNTQAAFNMAAEHHQKHMKAHQDITGYSYHHSPEYSYEFNNQGQLINIANHKPKAWKE